MKALTRILPALALALAAAGAGAHTLTVTPTGSGAGHEVRVELTLSAPIPAGDRIRIWTPTALRDGSHLRDWLLRTDAAAGSVFVMTVDVWSRPVQVYNWEFTFRAVRITSGGIVYDLGSDVLYRGPPRPPEPPEPETPDPEPETPPPPASVERFTLPFFSQAQSCIHGLTDETRCDNPTANSFLHIVNRGSAAADVTVTGADLQGRSGSAYRISVPAGQARKVWGYTLEGRDGFNLNGSGPWSLVVGSASADLEVAAFSRMGVADGGWTALPVLDARPAACPAED